MNLYIIGNGFDLYHGLDTTYKSFYNYFKKADKELFNMTCGLLMDQFNENDRLWSNFEEELGEFNYMDFVMQEGKYDDKADIHKVEPHIKLWKAKLDTVFKSWIISTVGALKLKRSLFGEDDIFLNFNYTDSLQKIYGVNEKQILYIHNSIKDKELIYGHGQNYIYEELLQSYGLVKGEIIEYYDEAQLRDVWILYKIGSLLKKDVEEVISSHNSFVKRLKGIKNIIVIGHSLSDIDLPYFKWINQNVGKNVKWTVSYYNNKENPVRTQWNKMKLEKQIKKANIKNYILLPTEDILH